MNEITISFIHLARAHYGEANLKLLAPLLDEIHFDVTQRVMWGDDLEQDVPVDSGLKLEWTVNGKAAAVQLTAWDDSWKTLPHIVPLLVELRESGLKFTDLDPADKDFHKHIEKVCEWLVSKGCVDATPLKP